jgi:hypothetical protein
VTGRNASPWIPGRTSLRYVCPRMTKGWVADADVDRFARPKHGHRRLSGLSVFSSANLIHALLHLPYPASVPFAGTLDRDGGLAGRDRRLRCAADAAVWPGRFRHQASLGALGPLRVEIEHTQAPGRALDPIGATTLRQVQGEARGAASRREQKSPAGRVCRATYLYFGRHGLAPRFPVL